MRHYFYRDLNNDFKTIVAQSKDSNRLFVTLESIEENTNKLAQEIQNVLKNKRSGGQQNPIVTNTTIYIHRNAKKRKL